MAPEASAASRHLVLAGGGHSHALLLRMWAMRPRRRPAAAITLVNRRATAFYSGMVPGLVAGHYRDSECAIDLRRLCRLAGAAFVAAEIEGVEPQRRELLLQGRPPLRWDRLSLDVGAVSAEAPGLAVKPLEPFLAHCAALQPGGAPLRIRGGGAAAVEVALALRGRGVACELLLRGDGLHLGSASANRLGERLLQEAAIPVRRRQPEGAAADLACTGSRGPAWLAGSGLPVDPGSGRVLTEATLEVLDHPGLFASGDCGLIAADPRPASGVWAVRAARPLAENLRRSLAGTPLRLWRPQARALQLLGVAGAPPRAVALWGPLALGPWPWLWRWKERIDRRFMECFADLQPMEDPAGGAMACRGCAAKLAAAPLEGALARLHGGEAGGAPAAEDAVVVGRGAGGEWLLQSVDGFPALVSDPWLNGRLTALHACSDLWASGAEVRSLLAGVTLPAVGAELQEELLLQSLAGIRSVLEPLGAALLGGHTLEARPEAPGPRRPDSNRPPAVPSQEISLLLTVNGSAPEGLLWPKRGLQPGDCLLLSRPIGSGVLFAAAQGGAARPEWIEAALAQMQTSQAPLVPLLARFGCRCCTDITGFGLLGHLGEMLEPEAPGAGPGLTVWLEAGAVPALPGSLELLAAGHASTLAPANAAALTRLGGPIQLVAHASSARLGLLIDPQTCGPLLAALPEEEVPAALAALAAAGFPEAAVVGRVRAAAG
ncbi:MAG: AIR synthase-related protein [Synechococcus sp.]|nr:AIR synthase-related protein [Synechococcus sp.]